MQNTGVMLIQLDRLAMLLPAILAFGQVACCARRPASLTLTIAHDLRPTLDFTDPTAPLSKSMVCITPFRLVAKET